MRELGRSRALAVLRLTSISELRQATLILEMSIMLCWSCCRKNSRRTYLFSVETCP